MKSDSVIFAAKGDLPERTKSGQAMVEYVIMTVLLITTATILAIFLYTYKQHSDRVVNLVASEYP